MNQCNFLFFVCFVFIVLSIARTCSHSGLGGSEGQWAHTLWVHPHFLTYHDCGLLTILINVSAYKRVTKCRKLPAVKDLSRALLEELTDLHSWLWRKTFPDPFQGIMTPPFQEAVLPLNTCNCCRVLVII